MNLLRTAIAAAFTVSLGFAALADEPAGMGTYKLNPAKSKFSPGPAPKSSVAKFEPAGKAGVKVTVDTVTADGKSSSYSYTANYDGKDAAMVGLPTVDKTSLKRIDPMTTVRTDKKDGKVVSTLTRTVSKDGKSMVVDIKGTTEKGEPVAHKAVFDRQ